MLDITLDQIKSATRIVYAEMQPTPPVSYTHLRAHET